jgi:uncharacterized lipoprotein NlpE involved in copper resistance
MKLIIVLCSSFFFFSCKKGVTQGEIKMDTVVEVAATNQVPTSGDNSQNSLDWCGSYKGITPCADCEGIETEVILNLDLTYVMKTKYLGKGDGKVFVEKGNFAWDKTGGSISVQGGKGSSSQYKVGENQLIQLDMEGKLITGDLGDMFVLRK